MKKLSGVVCTLVWIIRGFFLINHDNTHHSDTYMHYIFIDWRRDDFNFSGILNTHTTFYNH
jgi:hypothetical protein